MNKKYYCKEPDCNNEIHWATALYGSGRCQSCGIINFWNSKKGKETKKRFSSEFKDKGNPHYNKIETKCNNCGVTIYVKQSRFKRLKHHFCCKECFHVWLKINKIQRKCLVCGKELKRYDAKLCNVHEAMRRHEVGIFNSKGTYNGNYKKGVTLEKHYCIKCKVNEISLSNWYYGSRLCRKCNLSPNKPEKLLNNLLQEILLNEYKFVGDGSVILGGFCPDFINTNGQKKIIELYGNYWHNKLKAIKRDKRRLKTYNKLGFNTLIIWQHELKNLELTIAKIMEFDLKEKFYETK